MRNKIKVGDYVVWNNKALIDFNPEHWWATSKIPVKVVKIETAKSGFFKGMRTVHFETPIERNWAGETNSCFEHWIERCVTPTYLSVLWSSFKGLFFKDDKLVYQKTFTHHNGTTS